jgi:hypothetical protein
MHKKIPSKIHFVFLNKDEEMPEAFKVCYERTKKFHPDWDIKMYNEDDANNILMEHFPSLIPIYNSYTHVVQKSDILRVILVYLYGGFYMDLDMYCLKSLDELCAHELVLGKEFLITEDELYRIGAKHRMQIANYMFGSRARHPFWLSFLKESIEVAKHDIHYENDIIKVTGPQLMTNVYYKYKRQYKDITLLSNIDRECIRGHWAISCHFGNFAGHLHKGTWRWRSGKSTLPQKIILQKDNYKIAIADIDKLLKTSPEQQEIETVILKADIKSLKYALNLRALYQEAKGLCKTVTTTAKMKGKIVLAFGDPFTYKNKINEHNTNILYTIPDIENIETEWVCFVNEYYHYCIVPHEHIKKYLLDAGVVIPIQTIELGFNRPRRNFADEDEDEVTDFTISFFATNKNDLDMVTAACENIKKNNIPNLKLKLTNATDYQGINKFLKECCKSKSWIETVEISKILSKIFAGIHCYIFLDPKCHWSLGPREILYAGTPSIVSNHPFYNELFNSNSFYIIETNKYSTKDIEKGILEMYNNYAQFNENALKAGRWIEDKGTLEFTMLEIFRFIIQNVKNKTVPVKFSSTIAKI